MAGNGVDKNPQKGVQLCADYARLGNPAAQLLMGRFLWEGEPSIRNPEQALGWFQLAAEKGSAEALYFLGLMSRDGIALSQNLPQALGWLEAAASQGIVAAYLPTGQLYFGKPDDHFLPTENALAKAYLWLSAASLTAENPQREQAEILLQEVRKIMPETWAPELDVKVQGHLTRFHAAGK